MLNGCFVQAQVFSSIDWKTQSLEEDAAEPLARKLTGDCKTEMEKVKTIFAWIAGNIAYQVKPRYNRPGKINHPTK